MSRGALVRRASVIPGLLTLALAACGGNDGPDLATIQVTPNPLTLAQQQTAQLQASVLNDNGELVSGIAITFRSSNAEVASVSNTGLVTAGRSGTATITLEAEDLEAEVPVTVTAVSNAITLSPSPGVVAQNGSLQMTATVTDLAGQVVPNPPLTFTVSSPALASISPSGLLTPVGPAGQVTVTATSSALHASVQVAITQVPTTLVVSPNPLTLGKSSTLKFTTVVQDVVHAPMPPVPTTFTSSDPALATVAGDGTITGKGAVGTLTVTVAAAGLTQVVPVSLVEVGSPAGILDGTVNALPDMLAYGIDVSPSGDILLVGTSTGNGAMMARATMANRVFTSLPVSGGFATDVAFSSTGTAWIANIAPAQASEINPQTGQVLGTTSGIVEGGTRFRIDIAGDGAVFLAGDGHVYKINPATRAVTWDALVGNVGFSLAWNEARGKYYTAGNGQVYEVDASTGATRAVGSNAATNVAVSADGNRLYAVSENTTLTVLDIDTGAIVTTWTLPCAMWGIEMALDGTKLVASCPSGSVLFINPTDGTVLSTVTTGGTPRRIAFTPDGTFALVADNMGYVHFIR